jgi:lipoate-protein ligase A
MALDHYLACRFDRLKTGIIRFYGWHPFCVSLGFHQPLNYLLQQRLKSAGYDLVRRPTGGRAILHAEELTYSIIFNLDFMPPRELYRWIHTIIAAGLHDLGFQVTLEATHNQIPAPQAAAGNFLCFTHSSFSEIQYQGKKLVGSAQRIYPGCILQHGSILVGSTHARLSELINSSEQEKARMDSEIKNKTVTLGQIRPGRINPEKIMGSIIKQLELSLTISLNFEDITPAEKENIRDFIIPL